MRLLQRPNPRLVSTNLPQMPSSNLREMPPSPSSLLLSKTLMTSSLLKTILLLSAALSIVYLLLFSHPLLPSASVAGGGASIAASTVTAPRHLRFGIASSWKTLPRRKDYLRLWWRPGLTRGFLFLDRPLPPSAAGDGDDENLPPIAVSDAAASRFPYTFKPGGLRSAVRVARIVKELVDSVDKGLQHGDVRWIVLGDDDTVWFPDNLALTLAKYDWERWYYIGGLSESVHQNVKNSFGMAFGGGGFAISYPLARVLSQVLDSCLVRYGHLYGSDARVFSCLAELGVGLTREAGFHQVDLRGDLFGVLSAHPLTPLVSLHHLDNVDPLFQGMNRTAALKHLFEAVNVDSGRILQQTVCYDRWKLRTVSVSWGYAVQVYEGNQLLPDLLSLQLTFTPWKRSRDVSSGLYMFNTREFPRDPCKRPAIFFLESVFSSKDMIESNYGRNVSGNCQQSISSTENLQHIKVSSEKLDLDIEQLLSPRRHCCDILASSSDKIMELDIRKCKDNELIAMDP